MTLFAISRTSYDERDSMRKSMLIAAMLLGCGALLTGCTNRSKEQPGVTPPQDNNAEHVKIELQPEGTPERVRRVFYNCFNEKLRCEIEFRDGTVGGEAYFADGKMKEQWRTHPDSKQVQVCKTFAPDGTTVVTSLEYHKNGKVHKDTRRQKDGGYLVSEYWDSGIAMSDLQVRADGSMERVYYGDDGKRVRSRLAVHVTGEVDDWAYDEASGRLESHSHWLKNGAQDVKFFRPDGSLSHRQWWHILRNFDTSKSRSHRGWILDRVEQYGADGRTLVCRLKLSPGKKDINPVEQVEHFAADGSRTVRRLSGGQKVSSEETFAADGTQTGSQAYSDGNEPVEKIDKALLECWHVIGHKFDNYD